MTISKRQQLADLFRKFLAQDSVIDQPSSLAAYECDGLSAYRKTPLLVVLPETIEQVQQAVALCDKRRIPIVSRGAGTGLSGGALPHEDGIVLSLSKMSRIIKIDKLSRTGIVEPGESVTVYERGKQYSLRCVELLESGPGFERFVCLQQA